MLPADSKTTSVRNPFAEGIVTGKARYTSDIPPIDGLLHLKVLRSPHAHAKLLSIDRSDALAVPGVVAVIPGKTFRDVVTRRRFTRIIALTPTTRICLTMLHALSDSASLRS